MEDLEILSHHTITAFVHYSLETTAKLSLVFDFKCVLSSLKTILKTDDTLSMILNVSSWKIFYNS